jgi:hypothetical protein
MQHHHKLEKGKEYLLLLHNITDPISEQQLFGKEENA